MLICREVQSLDLFISGEAKKSTIASQYDLPLPVGAFCVGCQTRLLRSTIGQNVFFCSSRMRQSQANDCSLLVVHDSVWYSTRNRHNLPHVRTLFRPIMGTYTKEQNGVFFYLSTARRRSKRDICFEVSSELWVSVITLKYVPLVFDCNV